MSEFEVCLGCGNLECTCDSEDAFFDDLRVEREKHQKALSRIKELEDSDAILRNAMHYNKKNSAVLEVGLKEQTEMVELCRGTIDKLKQENLGLVAKLAGVVDWVGSLKYKHGFFKVNHAKLAKLSQFVGDAAEPIAVVNMRMCIECHGNFGTKADDGEFHCQHCHGIMPERTVVILPREGEDDGMG